MGEVVHVALKGDEVAMCDVPIDRSAPRASEPDQATCGGCIDIYIDGWAASRADAPVGAPPKPWHPLTWRRPDWLMAAAGAAVGLAIASGAYAFTSGEEGAGHVSASVVDCSQTQLFRPEGSSAMLPARVAQIRFVNNGDAQETFSAQVDGVILERGDGSPATFTLPPQGSKVISYPMNPERHGTSEGSCFALNVRAAQ